MTPETGKESSLASGKRAGYGFAANIIALAITTVERLISVAVLVRLWGPGIYGDWLILVAVGGLISLADLGTRAYFSNGYQVACAQGDVLGFQRLLRIAMGCRVTVVGLAAAAAVAGALVLDIREAFGLSVLDEDQAFLVMGLFALDALLLFPRDSLSEIYRAKGEYARSVLLSALMVIGKLTVVGGAIAFDSGPVSVAACLVVSTLILGWGVLLADLRRFADVTLGISFPSWKEIAEIAAISKWYALSSGANQVSLYIPVLVIGALVGAGPIVVGFTASRTLVNLARQMPTYLAMSSSIELSRLYYGGSAQPLASLFIATGLVCCALSGLLTGAVLGFGQAMLTIWTGEASLYDPHVLTLLSLPLLLTAPALPARMLVYYANRARQEGIGAGLQLLLLLPLVPGLTTLWGVHGAALALGIAEGIAIGVYFLRIGARNAGTALSHYLRRCLPLLVISFGLSWGAAVLIGRVVEANSVAGFILAVCVWAVFVPAPVLAAALPQAVRRRVFSALLRAVTGWRGSR